MVTNWYKQSFSEFRKALELLKPKIVKSVQNVYDEWKQNEDGVDEEFGSGGICDEVNREIASVIYSSLDVDNVVEGGQEGDEHSWSIVRKGSEIYGIDIPPWRYESGGGYNWKKIPEVKFTPDMIEIFPMQLPEDYEW